MATAHAEVDIHASPAEVLEVLADLPHYPQWSSVHRQAAVEELDAKGRPKRATMAVAAAGMVDRQTLDYTWRSDGMDWSLARATTQQRRQVGRYTISDEGGDCHVSYDLTIDPLIPVPGFLVRTIMKKAVTAATEGLKQRVESHPAHG